MKQAILVTAYKNVNHLRDMVEFFDDDYVFYIHLDKKSKVEEKELHLLANDKRVHLFHVYKTNWGGINHLKSILFLMEMALKDTSIEYLHLLSGHDFPINSPEFISDFVKKNKDKQFIEYFELPAKNWENGGRDRFIYYNLHDYIDAKGRYGQLLHKFIRLQKKFDLKRNASFGGLKLYGGSTWWSLSYDCCNYVKDFIHKNSDYLKRFKFTFCAEEIFFQTIVLNSPFKDKVVNNNLRHIVWEMRNGNIPAVLDETDLESLKGSSHLFARRFDYPASEKIISLLKEKNRR